MTQLQEQIVERLNRGELGALEIAELIHLSPKKTIAYILKLEQEEAAKCRA